MRRTLGVFGLAAGLAFSQALAQQSTDPNQQGPTYVPLTKPSPLGGVPSAAPRPGIHQGTPAALPQVTPPVGVPSRSTPVRTTPIIRPQQQTPPVVIPTQPRPQVPGTVVDNTRSNLVRRLLDARYGPGYSVVDGRLIQDQNHGWVTPAVNPLDGTVRGFLKGNDLRVGFWLGNNLPTMSYRLDTSYGKYPPRLYRSYYSGYEDFDRYRNSCSGYDNPYLIVGGDRSYVVDPRLTTQTDTAGVVVRELSPLEKAEIALRTGDEAEAVKQLKLHLKESPDDAGVERLLAIALLDDRKVDQGVAVLLHAYIKQPALAADALDPRQFSGGELEHRQRFSIVMDYANRVKTGASYFAASVLAQSEGRFDTAKKMLDKAIAAGLDKKVAEEMRAGIANR